MTEEKAWELRSAIAELAAETGATGIEYGGSEAELIDQLEKLQDLAVKDLRPDKAEKSVRVKGGLIGYGA
jgi:hypothetical protein